MKLLEIKECQLDKIWSDQQDPHCWSQRNSTWTSMLLFIINVKTQNDFKQLKKQRSRFSRPHACQWSRRIRKRPSTIVGVSWKSPSLPSLRIYQRKENGWSVGYLKDENDEPSSLQCSSISIIFSSTLNKQKKKYCYDIALEKHDI